MGYEQNVNKVCRRVGKREDTLPFYLIICAQANCLELHLICVWTICLSVSRYAFFLLLR